MFRIRNARRGMRKIKRNSPNEKNDNKINAADGLGRWRYYVKAGFGAAMSAISFAAIAVLVCGFVVMVSNVVPEYIGIVQRANIGAFYIYLTLLSMRLFARTRIEHSAPSASSR